MTQRLPSPSPAAWRAFWDADLSDIEEKFLQGKRITQLPVYLNGRVPPQGSVLLAKTIDVEEQMADRQSLEG